MSIADANDGSLVGAARAEVIRDFHKSATAQRLGIKLAGDVGESTVSAEGTQHIAPNSGKTKLMKVLVDKHGNPLVSSAPDSEGHTMLESFKQANAGTTLYDILMHEKQAGDVGEYDSEQYLDITKSNENSNRRILDDAYVLSGVSKQEAKAPVRARLREAFAGTSDSLGDQTVKGMFPAAYQASGLKKTANYAPARPGKMSREMFKDVSKNRAAQQARIKHLIDGQLSKTMKPTGPVSKPSGGNKIFTGIRKMLTKGK